MPVARLKAMLNQMLDRLDAWGMWRVWLFTEWTAWHAGHRRLAAPRRVWCYTEYTVQSTQTPIVIGGG